MTTDITPELLPCPFCEGEARKGKQHDIFFIACKSCSGMSGFYAALEDAIKAWNKRA